MRGLKTLVIVFGMLIVVSMGLLGWGFYNRLRQPPAAGAEKAPAPAKTAAAPTGWAESGEVRVPLPEGCTIAEMRPEGNRLFIRTGPSGQCERIVVIDVASGRTLGTILVRP